MIINTGWFDQIFLFKKGLNAWDFNELYVIISLRTYYLFKKVAFFLYQNLQAAPGYKRF